MNEVIILAGGFGTRLQSVVKDLPKCLVEINGKPFLSHLIDFLLNQNFTKFIFAIGYKSDLVEEFVIQNYGNLEYSFSVETEPLGTGGAIKKALKTVKSNDVLVVNGDTFFNVNLAELFEFHLIKNAHVSIGLFKVEENTRYGYVELSIDGRIHDFHEKKLSKDVLISGGYYVINVLTINTLFEQFPNHFSLEKDFFELKLKEVNIFGKLLVGNFIDIGIPEDLYLANKILI